MEIVGGVAGAVVAVWKPLVNSVASDVPARFFAAVETRMVYRAPGVRSDAGAKVRTSLSRKNDPETGDPPAS